MERLKHIKEAILGCIEGEVCDLNSADTKELGEAIDMLKDLEEAIYYATITKAMHANENREYKGEREVMYYPYPMYYSTNDSTGNSGSERDGRRHYMNYYDPYRDMDREMGKMYYSGSSSSGNQGGNSGGGSRAYHDMEYPYLVDMRDKREGRSPMSRKMYMEAKEMHHGKEAQLKELDKYMQELTGDITEMIKETSPEEKQLLQKKIAALAEKVGQINV